MLPLRKSAKESSFFRTIEYLYFAFLFYSTVLWSFGLGFENIGILFLGTVGLLVLLRIHPLRALELPFILFPFMITVTTLFVIFFIHQEVGYISIIGPFFITWLLNSIILSQLVLNPGFLPRLTVWMFVCAVLTLRNIQIGEPVETVREIQRVTSLVESGLLANPNALGAWLGYCSIGFFGWGFFSNDRYARVLLWILSGTAFLLVLLTVSRSSLLSTITAILLSIVYVMRRSRSGAISILLTVLLAGIFILSTTGILDVIWSNYQLRGVEDSGRTVAFEAGVQATWDYPLTGLGARGELLLDASNKFRSPHNAFLRLSTIAGVGPSILLGAMFWMAFRKMEKFERVDEVFWLPALFIFVFLQINVGNWYFTTIWATTTISFAMVYQFSDDED